MKTGISKFITAAFASIILTVIICSCGKEYNNEFYAGPYKITKVEIARYKNLSATPDSIVTYESDTLGYFNLYNSSPRMIYVAIKYPSQFLVLSYTDTFAIHKDNPEILIISNNGVTRQFTRKDYQKKKQEWTMISDDIVNGNQFRETIFVEKQ